MITYWLFAILWMIAYIGMGIVDNDPHSFIFAIGVAVIIVFDYWMEYR